MKIGIVGNYGNNNQGDEAILDGILTQLETYYLLERKDILVFSNNPVQTRERYGVQSVNLFQRRKTDPMKFISTVIHNRPIIRDLDVLLIGGGGILMDLYRNNPFVYGMYGLLAKITKTPAVIYGAGAGPINTNIGKKIIKAIGNTAKIVMVRDSKSKELLKRIGVKKPIEVITDPAFFLETPKKLKNDKAGLQIGVTAVPYYYKNYWPIKDEQKYQRYIHGMANNFDSILERYPTAYINFFSTHPRDIPVTKEIKQLMKQEARCTVYDSQLTHKEILGIISEQDLVIGTRLHSLILAIVANKPIIAISYHHKVQDFMESIGCNDNVIAIDRLDEQNDFFLSVYENMNEDWETTIERFKNILQDLRENSGIVHLKKIKTPRPKM